MDRVTGILANAAAAKQAQNPPPLPVMATNDPMQAWQAQNPQAWSNNTVDAAAEIIGQAQQGNPQAQAAIKSADNFVQPGDTQGLNSYLNYIHDLPEQIDPSNPYQVMTAGTRWMKETGYKASMPSPIQIATQDKINIMNGKGSNIIGLEQESAKNLAMVDKLQTVASSGGGGGGVTGFVYNKMKSALEAKGIQITPEMDLQLINAARNGLQKGATITVNGQQIAVENILGVEGMLEAQAAASQQGEKGVDAIMNPIIRGGEKTAEYGAERDNTAAKKAVAATTSNQIIADARALLPKATGSLAGAGVDILKRGVGISNENSQANQSLKALAGWLTSNVPRMEGPQSNFDVGVYQEMAAKVGDSTIPIGDRFAALDVLEQINNRYAHLNGGGSSQQAPQGEVNFNDLPD